MSMLEILEKEAAEPQAAPPKSEEAKLPQEKPSTLVPRALLNRPKAKSSTAKSTAAPFTAGSKTPSTRTNAPLTSNSNLNDAQVQPSAPIIPVFNASEDLANLASLPDLYSPSTPNSYYELIYKPKLQQLAKLLTETESDKQLPKASAPVVNIGEKLLFKQGWKGIGFGLGKDDQGMAAPLIAERTAGTAKGSIQKAELQSKISRAIVLVNMASRGSADEALATETKEDCSAFGAVLSCIARESPDASCEDHECVRIFVLFEAVESAQKAKKSLHNKKFAGRLVQAFFYPESALQADQLWIPLRSD